MLQTILLVLHVIVAISLIVFILLQQGRGATTGAAFGSGASSTVFGARGSASFLSRTTSILAIVFFANCLLLAFLGAQRTAPSSVLEHLSGDSAPLSVGGDAPPVPATAPAAGDTPPTPPADKGAADMPDIPPAKTSP
ncbi:MAG: preprotein translocase subunit SecG [Gammaproteobacteria bacterium]|nr:preprotein translocase subunit SecG [Gammaproteobacteria bacterium]